MPEFLGNRAPFADPDARAVIAGLGMETTLDSLVALYVAGLCGLGYGVRQIIETQAAHGAPVERIVISGGAGRDPIWSASCSPTPAGLPVVAVDRARSRCCSARPSSARSPAGAYPDIPAAMAAMSRVAATAEPAGGAIAETHARRYEAFQVLQRTARTLPRE